MRLGKRSWFAGSLVLGLALLVSGLTGCQDDKSKEKDIYADKGHKGTEGWDGATAPKRADHTVNVNVKPAIPVTLTCGTTYPIDIDISQTTDCKGLDNLLKLVQNLAALRAAQVQCPAGGPCTIKQVYFNLWNWSCKGGVATMQCKEKIVCLKAGDPTPAGVTPPSAPLTAGGTNIMPGETKTFDDFIGDGEVIKAYFPKTGNVWQIPCTKQVLGCVIYQEGTKMVGGGAAPASYKEYVDRADHWAALYASQYSCAPKTPPCTPSIMILRDEWDFDASKEVVIVKVYFQVDCK
jgi:hypothetical protein